MHCSPLQVPQVVRWKFVAVEINATSRGAVPLSALQISPATHFRGVLAVVVRCMLLSVTA
jgi:hypothetical protein